MSDSYQGPYSPPDWQDKPRKPPGLSLATAIFVFGVVLLPILDTFDQLSLLNALGGLGFGRSSSVDGLSFLLIFLPVLPWLLGALAIARCFRLGRRWQVPVVLAAALAVAGYGGVTGWRTAMSRSASLNSYRVCEDLPEYRKDPRVITTRSEMDPAGWWEGGGGPHSTSGNMCVLRAEKRRPGTPGDVADGLRQIWVRFTDEQFRVFFAPVLALVLVLLSLPLLRRVKPVVA